MELGDGSVCPPPAWRCVSVSAPTSTGRPCVCLPTCVCACHLSVPCTRVLSLCARACVWSPVSVGTCRGLCRVSAVLSGGIASPAAASPQLHKHARSPQAGRSSLWPCGWRRRREGPGLVLLPAWALHTQSARSVSREPGGSSHAAPPHLAWSLISEGAEGTGIATSPGRASRSQRVRGAARGQGPRTGFGLRTPEPT